MKKMNWGLAILLALMAIALSAMLVRGCASSDSSSAVVVPWGKDNPAPPDTTTAQAVSPSVSTPALKPATPSEEKAKDKMKKKSPSSPRPSPASPPSTSKSKEMLAQSSPPSEKIVGPPIISQEELYKGSKGDGECFSYYRKLLPSVNPLWIEDFCVCAERELGEEILQLTTPEQRIAGMKSKAEICYGVRLNKVAEAQDKKFYRSCVQNMGVKFPAYANVHPRRKAGFCSCYVTGVSTFGFDANVKIPTSVENHVRSYCTSAYPAKI